MRSLSDLPLATPRAARHKNFMSLEADLIVEQRRQIRDGEGQACGNYEEAAGAEAKPLAKNGNDVPRPSWLPRADG
jgi:hypothetical protein